MCRELGIEKIEDIVEGEGKYDAMYVAMLMYVFNNILGKYDTQNKEYQSKRLQFMNYIFRYREYLLSEEYVTKITEYLARPTCTLCPICSTLMIENRIGLPICVCRLNPDHYYKMNGTPSPKIKEYTQFINAGGKHTSYLANEKSKYKEGLNRQTQLMTGLGTSFG